MARDRATHRRSTDRPGSGDGSVEDMLRQIGADILDEPVPERLRRLLRPEDGPDPPPDAAKTDSGAASESAGAEERMHCTNGECCD